jgi:hypothetical protein
MDDVTRKHHGTNIIATINDAHIATITVPDNWVNKAVLFVFNNNTGTNITIVVKLDASKALVNCLVDVIICSSEMVLLPECENIVSMTMMLLSTTIPVAIAIAERVITLSVIPTEYTYRAIAIKENGIAIITAMVACKFFRNKNTINMVRIIPAIQLI